MVNLRSSCTLQIYHLYIERVKKAKNVKTVFKQHINHCRRRIYDGNLRDLLDILYYTGKPYRPRAQWEYKHRALRTIIGHRVARRARPLRSWLTSSRWRQIVRAGARFNALRNINQTPHFDCSRAYQTPMEMLSFEPLLMPDSGETSVYARREIRARECERCESRRADDRFHGWAWNFKF